jgi:predicted Rdx family selenoprotein
LPQATRAVEEIEGATGVSAELIPGGSGVFDVEKDGELIYSKSETGRFPQDGQLAGLLSG